MYIKPIERSLEHKKNGGKSFENGALNAHLSFVAETVHCSSALCLLCSHVIKDQSNRIEIKLINLDPIIYGFCFLIMKA